MAGRKMRLGVLAGAGAAAATAAAAAFAGTFTGPSTTTAPYVVPSQPGVHTASVLTAGDTVGGYQMVGIPDGLGAFDNHDGTFTVLMNQELRRSEGAVRAHGGTGAFVSKWIVSKRTLQVLSGQDLIQRVVLAPGSTETRFERFCSADLAALTAFYNPRTGSGYNGRLFMNGEETSITGRAFAHALDGTSYELPALGKYGFENVLANPATGDKTVTASGNDGTGNQVFVYVGTKQSTGNPVERAGLANGTLYGVRVPGLPQEADTTPSSAFPTRFELASLGDQRAKSGTQLQADANTALVTHFQRPEDGSWDPQHPNDFYFVTTASPTGKSRLWRLRFDDVKNPQLGGTVEQLLDGTEGQVMLDNITVDRFGRILMQEDPGSNDRVAKIFSYDIAKDTLTEVATHDPARFAPGAPGLITTDEETSGIIPLDTILGPGYYLFDDQVHTSVSGPVVEMGQLDLLYVPVPGEGDNRQQDDHNHNENR